jgi:two-component system, chemotaxis family, sensor kinase CheA
MTALSEQFIAESRELIQQATNDLIAVEREGFSDERIARVFRAFHTLKGSAGVVNLPAMGLVLHAAEDVLAAVQSGRLGATSAVIDRALACMDQVAGWVDDFEASDALPADAGEVASSMSELLRGLLGGAAATTARPSDVHVVPDWARTLLRSHAAKISARPTRAPICALRYEPRASCFFDGDDPLELMRRVPELLGFGIEPRETPPPLADMDPFSCNLRLLAVSASTHAELSTLFRFVPDEVRIIEIAPASLAAEPSANSGTEATLARAVIEEQTHVIRAAGAMGSAEGRLGSAMRVAANALRYSWREQEAQRIEQAGAVAISKAEPAPLLAAIDDVLRSWASDVGNHAGKSDNLSGQTSTFSGTRSLRVDETRIDSLVHLAGELLVIKNGFAHLARQLEGTDGGQQIARTLKVQNDALDRLAGELHDAALRLRMVPIAQVFRSFPRLVRDMSHQLGKKVSLVTRGESTESDKTIVDLLFEPLMHLVRNALDHGIERPERRSVGGKPETATITLQALRKGDRLVVEVSDDGRGIDPAAIRARAAEKGVLPAEELAVLTDEQAVDLIFSPGFSTASAVSDISGRGVGLDIVRSTAERIGGRVSVKTRVQAGTTITLDLPMNIALLRIMVVEADGHLFGVPMDAVAETVRLTPDRITRFKSNDGFVLHDRIIPICSLAELLNLPATQSAHSDVRLVIVAETGGKTAAFEVDGIRDRMEVVLKPMQGLLASARGYAGTTLLGDGAVLLVLDLKEILL